MCVAVTSREMKGPENSRLLDETCVCVCSCAVNSIIMLFEGREAVWDSCIDKLTRHGRQKDRSVSRVVLLHPEHNMEPMSPSSNPLSVTGGQTAEARRQNESPKDSEVNNMLWLSNRLGSLTFFCIRKQTSENFPPCHAALWTLNGRFNYLNVLLLVTLYDNNHKYTVICNCVLWTTHKLSFIKYYKPLLQLHDTSIHTSQTIS